MELAHIEAMPADAEPLPYYDPPALPFAQQKSELRAQAGRTVGEQLDRTPGLWRLGSAADKAIQLYIGDGFLTRDQCRAVCAQIDRSAYPSLLFDQEKFEGVRTSHSCNLDIFDPLIAEVEAKIAALLGIDRAFGEPLQGQRYEVGQCFRAHNDFFYIDQPYWAEYEPHGGQRTWTAMIYLAEPESGGGTAFPLLNLNVQPKLGRILVWNNMALDGSPNGWTLHEGCEVASGSKYIVTKWYRERTFV